MPLRFPQSCLVAFLTCHAASAEPAAPWDAKPKPLLEREFQSLLEAAGADAGVRLSFESGPAASIARSVPAGYGLEARPYPRVIADERLFGVLRGPDEALFFLAHELVHLLRGHQRRHDEFMRAMYAAWQRRNPRSATLPFENYVQGLIVQDTPESVKMVLDFDKSLEREADGEAVEFLAKAGRDPLAAEKALLDVAAYFEGAGLRPDAAVYDPLSVRAELVRERAARLKARSNGLIESLTLGAASP